MPGMQDTATKFGQFGWLTSIIGLHGRSYSCTMYTIHVSEALPDDASDEAECKRLFNVTLPATIRGQRIVDFEQFAKLTITSGPIMLEEVTDQAPEAPRGVVVMKGFEP